jgi:Tol biopolymer transport system component
VALVATPAGTATAGDAVLVPQLLSARADASPGNAPSGTFGLATSGDGSVVTFASLATDLDPRDTDPVLDVYVVRGESTPEVVSVTADGVKGNAISTRPEVSADGRFVTFASASTNLDPRAVDGGSAVYVKDLQTGDLVLGSTASDGTPADGASSQPVLSGDGGHVAFVSRAANLDPRDTDDAPDVYVKDLHTGELQLVTISQDGVKAQPGPFGIGTVAISGDGSHVAFDTDAVGLDPSDTDTTPDIFVKNWMSGALEAATPGPAPGGSTSPSLSQDGRRVAFETYRTGLDPLDTDEETSVYVRDLDSGTVTLASTLPDGAGSGHRATQPSLSADASTVAFASDAPDLTGGALPALLRVYVRRLDSPDVLLASVDDRGRPADALSIDPALAGDASSVVFATPAPLVATDTNLLADAYRALLPGVVDPPPAEAAVTADVTTEELVENGERRVMVTVHVVATHPAGIRAVATRLIDAKETVQAVRRSSYDGPTSLERTDHFVLCADDLGAAGTWQARVRIRGTDDTYARTEVEFHL